MRRYFCVVACFAGMIFLTGPSTEAATVTCQVKVIDGDTLVLEKCDPKRLEDFRQGEKVKVKQDKGR